MIVPTRSRVAAECDRLRDELLEGLDAYRKAKRRFSDRTLHYRRLYGPSDGEIQARSDYQRQQAIADCGWYAQEIQVAAAALTALTTTRED